MPSTRIGLLGPNRTSTPASPRRAEGPASVARLQRGIGNRAVARLLSRSPSGTDSTVGLLVIDLSPDNALLTLKRAETRLRQDPGWVPTDVEREELDRAIALLEATQNYLVDRDSFVVEFASFADTKITSVEDFIVFVEAVEREFPAATPGEVVGEIRQLEYRGGNWKAMLNSSGIREDGKEIDLEQKSFSIAREFDLPQIKEAGHHLATKFGEVDIWHVVAGIDAALNGAAESPDRAGNNPDSEAYVKWKALHDADKGDPRDFATWSGDLGQAYAEYLYTRRYEPTRAVSLAGFVQAKAAPEALRGDLHGYLAARIYQATPASAAPGEAGPPKLSDILSTIYMVDRTGTAGSGKMGDFFVAASGVPASDIQAFVADRALAFAALWYAKVVTDHRGPIHYGLTPGGVLDNLRAEFEEQHALNEQTAAPGNRMENLVMYLLPMLDAGI
jgi:hypothetical protein